MTGCPQAQEDVIQVGVSEWEGGGGTKRNRGRRRHVCDKFFLQGWMPSGSWLRVHLLAGLVLPPTHFGIPNGYEYLETNVRISEVQRWVELIHAHLLSRRNPEASPKTHREDTKRRRLKREPEASLGEAVVREHKGS